MEEYNRGILVKEIMLDKNNPRFGGGVNCTQEEIKDRLIHAPKVRELLVGMRAGLVWSNKISVMLISDLSKNELDIIGEIPLDKKYIVVDGNTRLACILENSMKGSYDINKPIPVNLLVKAKGESDIEFLLKRKRIQGINNIMIVTDWHEIPKSKHLYDTYMITKKIEHNKSENQIFKKIGEDIGISLARTKSAVFRYVFYKELVENVQELDRNDYKYLEVFEVSYGIRALFGYSTDKGKFIWDMDNDKLSEEEEETIEKRKELLYAFPKIIEIAINENISSKTLRDIICEYKNKDFEDLLQKFKDIQDYRDAFGYAANGIRSILESDVNQEEEELKHLKQKVDAAIKTLRQFPINEKYAVIFKNKLIEINKSSEKLLKYLEMYPNA
ncbi:hypothetical protein psyc5s11_29130 [Clostridium gelidum]|uniref:ParB/Sulfiredoxin domain-containing protein n=1 Tax=Clostridium gelidum TaxID=704125 RepID=A0ABN6J1J5_9CLOT|nr:hypothetical protein [Clostridium gelidum]BCZ46846.1 hypothetical protein psyc5s11_29130 [Clostridium gelidum]